VAMWTDVQLSVKRSLDTSGLDFLGGCHGAGKSIIGSVGLLIVYHTRRTSLSFIIPAGHAVLAVLPQFVLCDRTDIGTHSLRSFVMDDFSARPPLLQARNAPAPCSGVRGPCGSSCLTATQEEWASAPPPYAAHARSTPQVHMPGRTLAVWCPLCTNMASNCSIEAGHGMRL
jgi:hypothetical protein